MALFVSGAGVPGPPGRLSAVRELWKIPSSNWKYPGYRIGLSTISAALE